MASQTLIDPLANKFYLLRYQRLPRDKKGKVTPWDPWPVPGFRRSKDPVSKAAQKLIRDRNHASIDNYIDRIVLLPASSTSVPEIGGARCQGGSERMRLYSIRSPSTLPVKVFLWQTPSRKIMVRCGLKSVSLDSFVSSWTNAARANGPDCFCKQYHFWKSIKVDEDWLRTIPRHLHQQVHERWWTVNGFRFLDLPFELREMILQFAMGPCAEPFAQLYEKGPYPSITPSLPTAPLMSLVIVNKQLHQEALQTLYAHTTFFLRSMTQMEQFLFKRAIPSQVNLLPSRQRLRYLELHLNACELLSILDLTMHMNDTLPQYVHRHSRSQSCKNLRSVLAENLSMRCLRIHIPHVIETYRRGVRQRNCQKVFCLAFWAGAREFLGLLPTVEFLGQVAKSTREEWMEDLRFVRNGILPDPGDLYDWQDQVLTQCSLSPCECDPPCSTMGM